MPSAGSGAVRPRMLAARNDPSSRVAASGAPARSPSGVDMPRQAATSGVALVVPITERATSASGGLETSTMTSVPGSASRARTASRAIIPPTPADRSRPPTPITWDTPMPQRSSSDITSCAPVPAAATMPTGPEPSPADHRGARARSHPEPAQPAGTLLQRYLLCQGDVVAEEQDMQAGSQRAMGRHRGVPAGYRYHRHVRVRHSRRCLCDGPWPRTTRFLAGMAGLGEQRRLAPLHSVVRGLVAVGLDREDQCVA